MRSDHDAAMPNDSVDECRRIVRSLPADERAGILALAAAFEQICLEWNSYLDELSATHRANRYALASAIVVEAAVARRLAAGNGPQRPQEPAGGPGGLTESVRATSAEDRTTGLLGASGEGEARS